MLEAIDSQNEEDALKGIFGAEGRYETLKIYLT